MVFFGGVTVKKRQYVLVIKSLEQDYKIMEKYDEMEISHV